jgi:hypothetical protein
MTLALVALIALSPSRLHAQNAPDSSPHSVQFVTVDQGVKLEVLDWGGVGRPLIFLMGPILAIGVCPHDFDRANAAAAAKAAMVADDRVRCTAQADAFAAGVPSAHVVRLPNADHYVFNSKPGRCHARDERLPRQPPMIPNRRNKEG